MISIPILCPGCGKVVGKTPSRNGMGTMACSNCKHRVRYEVINGTPHALIVKE